PAGHPDGAQSDHLHDDTPKCNAALYGSTLSAATPASPHATPGGRFGSPQGHAPSRAPRAQSTSFLHTSYISIPAMPPRGMPPPACTSTFGLSAIITSVVSNSPATEAAFCSASRVTFVGSRMPSSSISANSPVAAL